MKGPIMRALSGVAAMAMAMGAAPLVAQSGPTDADLMNDAKSTGDVLTYGMGPQAHRFSALNAIRRIRAIGSIGSRGYWRIGRVGGTGTMAIRAIRAIR